MKLELEWLREMAGLPLKGDPLLESSRLEKLIGYYTDGFGGFGDSADSKKIKHYISAINGGSIKPGTPEYKEAASAILSYGSDVSADDLKNY